MRKASFLLHLCPGSVYRTFLSVEWRIFVPDRYLGSTHHRMSASEKKTRKAMDSDSDSGPLDRNPPQSPAKKQKTDGTAPQKNAEGEHIFELGRMRRITVKEFKGDSQESRY